MSNLASARRNGSMTVMTGPPVPRPPAAIWNELVAASTPPRDEARFSIAKEHYTRWLEANGYHVPHGTNRPDEAIR